MSEHVVAWWCILVHFGLRCHVFVHVGAVGKCQCRRTQVHACWCHVWARCWVHVWVHVGGACWGCTLGACCCMLVHVGACKCMLAHKCALVMSMLQMLVPRVGRYSRTPTIGACMLSCTLVYGTTSVCLTSLLAPSIHADPAM